jgi:hypothetical protein
MRRPGRANDNLEDNIKLKLGVMLIHLLQDRKEYVGVFIMITKTSGSIKDAEFHDELCKYSILKFHFFCMRVRYCNLQLKPSWPHKITQIL